MRKRRRSRSAIRSICARGAARLSRSTPPLARNVGAMIRRSLMQAFPIRLRVAASRITRRQMPIPPAHARRASLRARSTRG